MQYIPNAENDWPEMLATIGFKKLDDLMTLLPESLRLKEPLDLPPSLSEMELSEHILALSEKNKGRKIKSFLGAGAYDHYLPAVVDHILRRSEFYTAYTPYQPEISQGTLQAIFEFQTLICQLTGMDVANASVYDGASAVAEGVLMAHRLKGKKKCFLSATLHPEAKMVTRTYTAPLGVELVEIPYSSEGLTDLEFLTQKIDGDTFAVVLQQPNFFGCLEDLEKAGQIIHAQGALFIVAVMEPLALALMQPPGALGADLTVGEAQSFGLPLSYGGPYVGFFATKETFLRALPGRLVGETLDQQGRRGFVLALATREQHIRREKATSNICTNQALCALAVLVYLTLLGKEGLQRLAQINLSKCVYAQKVLGAKFSLPFSAPTFNEFVLSLPEEAQTVWARLLPAGIIPGFPLQKFYPELKKELLICLTEKTSKDDIDLLQEKLIDAVEGA